MITVQKHIRDGDREIVTTVSCDLQPEDTEALDEIAEILACLLERVNESR